MTPFAWRVSGPEVIHNGLIVKPWAPGDVRLVVQREIDDNQLRYKDARRAS